MPKAKKSHAENLEKLRVGIANRQEIVKHKEKEIGKLLPVQHHYIWFFTTFQKLIMDRKIGSLNHPTRAA
jgi:hypothetical protein